MNEFTRLTGTPGVSHSSSGVWKIEKKRKARDNKKRPGKDKKKKKENEDDSVSVEINLSRTTETESEEQTDQRTEKDPEKKEDTGSRKIDLTI